MTLQFKNFSSVLIMKQKQIIGNWKMHGTRGLAKEYMAAFLPAFSSNTSYSVGIAAPFTLLAYLSELVQGSGLLVGAQNMHEEDASECTDRQTPRDDLWA